MTSHDAANEILALTDTLAGQPMLRRSLSDPSAQTELRLDLARKLFGERVGEAAMGALEGVVRSSWRSPDGMVRGLQLEGINAALRAAAQEGALDRVTSELHTLGTAVAGSPELTSTLRSAAYDTEAKRALVVRLHGPDVHPVTSLLAARAVDGHERTFPKTIDSYLEMAAALAEAVVAKVTVARPLDQGRLDRLRSALSARMGKAVDLQVVVDPDVVGGVNIAVGHDVYESTVAGRLEDVRRQLINS